MRVLKEILSRATAYESEKRSQVYLALNENPFPFPKEILRDVFSSIDLDRFRIYYDSPDEEFLRKLRVYVGIDGIYEGNISVGNGADEIIYIILSMSKRAVFFTPTYSCYKVFSRALGVQYVELPLEKNLKIPSFNFQEGDVVFIPNPNNPTGHIFPVEDIERILESKAFIVLDEAYYEFSKVTYVDLVKEYENLAVVRTFSKAFSLAAQRIGYVISNETFIEAYNRVRVPYNLNYISQLLAKAALDNLELFERRIDYIITERERVLDKAKQLGFNVTDSKGNFIFIFLKKEEIEDIKVRFISKGISVRYFDEGIRISIGLREENDIILAELERLRGSRGDFYE
ncbi:pyridoxal phosphate-dependent aminotransferase [Fervidobacterium sp.]